ncbi:Bifunctional purine biosynthesis protein PurH [Microbotryomycetes sp. JL201]|nr:Bifunctional purine biosynthesis protein PurH [Microbotryomycetes sp. JL201]
MGSSVHGIKLPFVLTWVVAGALQYGFHISALNFQFGVVTSAYTIGGLASSLYTGRLADARGRKATALISAWLVVLATFWRAASPHVVPHFQQEPDPFGSEQGNASIAFGSVLALLVLGRILVGLACGISTVLVPLYLNELSPPSLKGNIGVLTQLSICAGILLAQSISSRWKDLIVTSPVMVETKSQIKSSNAFDAAEDEERAPLAGQESEHEPPSATRANASASMSVSEVLSSPDPAVKSALWTLALSQFFQQTSGINSVMYYSVGILTAVNPANAKVVAVFVTVVNFVMTLPAVYLIDRLGRRFLLLFSLTTMSIASLVLAYSINNSKFVLAATFIVLFVATFSVGLGPIPFVLTGELAPPPSRSATASVALAVNWVSNLLVVSCRTDSGSKVSDVCLSNKGLTFLPLRDWLAGGKADGSGTVFYVFAVMSALGCVVLAKRLSK